jgi:hypothetical protein
MRPLSPVQFKRAWDMATSVTHASVILRRWGYRLSPKEVLRYAWSLRRMGVELKKIPRGGFGRTRPRIPPQISPLDALVAVSDSPIESPPPSPLLEAILTADEEKRRRVFRAVREEIKRRQSSGLVGGSFPEAIAGMNALLVDPLVWQNPDSIK